ncbi:DUF1611 domain-containing protein [Corynebacterium crudilactis]|uniref:DUF1611 domain-containing protein n=1 Tax=Corynebacterium crudilactis TaxID=1652495 RepID=A0A172QQK6_9CORY|nr:DUF1611 domain-containing protein [Corynebacterium crudilactis]ANE02975.1 DUF1611 domain-containing protein [Corynebacterium crudilactis]
MTITLNQPVTTSTVLPLPARFQASYTTRLVAEGVEKRASDFWLETAGTPKAGDVVIARVTQINNHKRVETPESRKAILFEGALVMLAYGNRYAADQFLAHVPEDLGPCHLVAAGGIAGTVTALHDRMDEPTEIEPLGLLTDANGTVNVRDFAAHQNPLNVEAKPNRPQVIAVLGTSMNSGKSTTLACLVNGLDAAGHKVAAGKITGTGAGNDRMIYHDAGAHSVIDFTDFGYPTTFKLNFAEIRALSINMINVLADTGADTVIVEIADGIYQGETSRLLRDQLFQHSIDHVVFSAVDALGAKAGVSELQAAGLHVAAASGVMTASPLATAEATEVLNVPVIPTYDLTNPATVTAVLATAQKSHA